MSHRTSVVDLAADPAGPTSSISLSISPGPSSSAARPSTSTTRGIKRRRSRDPSDDDIFDDVFEHGDFDRSGIESIDLTGNASSSAVAKTVAKQTEDAINAQKTESEDKSQSILAAYRCPICMDPPENATTTVCGHLFCHACIIECLNRSDEQRYETNKFRGTCPVCRKSLSRSEAPGPRRGLIPLRLQLMTKKRNPVAANGA